MTPLKVGEGASLERGRERERESERARERERVRERRRGESTVLPRHITTTHHRYMILKVRDENF
jgi:hypothetical protein